MTRAAEVLDDLDSGLAAQMARLEARRRIIGWLRENAEEAAHLGFSVACEVQDAGVTLRIDWAGGVVPAPVEHPDGDRPATLIDADKVPASEAAPAAGVAGAPVSVTAPRPGRAVPWSAADDAVLMNAIAWRAEGTSKSEVFARLADQLPGRTMEAIKFRYHKLRTDADAHPAKPDDASDPAPDLDPEALPPAPVPDSPAAVVEPLPRWQRDLADRIDRMNARRPWAVADDLRLISAKSEGVGTARLAEEFGLSVRVVEERFHLLLPVKGPVEFERVLKELRRRAALEQGVAA